MKNVIQQETISYFTHYLPLCRNGQTTRLKNIEYCKSFVVVFSKRTFKKASKFKKKKKNHIQFYNFFSKTVFAPPPEKNERKCEKNDHRQSTVAV